MAAPGMIAMSKKTPTTPRGPGGRPPLPAHEQRVASTRADLTFAEKDYLRQQADLAGLSEAEYVRRRALGYRIEPAPRVMADPGLIVAINDLARQIKAIGTNYNQLLVSVHRGRNVREPIAAIHVSSLRGRRHTRTGIEENVVVLPFK